MNAPTLSVLVMSKSPAGVAEFLALNALSIDEIDELILVVTTNARFGGQAALANRIKRRSFGQVVGVVHADTVFEPGDFKVLAHAAWSGKVCGIVGVSSEPSGKRYVWGREIETEKEVSTLDCCSIFFRVDLPVEFDEATFDSFHCVNEDFCLAANARGIKTVVPKIRASHVGKSTGQADWQKAYLVYRERLSVKWKNVRFETT